jgi:hypothetical protein
MTNEEIKEKYGIEPIMKEMWVWDRDPKKAFFTLVIHRIMNQVNYPYKVVEGISFRNASETNPNNKEPQVGDIGYFWDNEDSYVFDELTNICQDGRPPYYASIGIWFYNFSHEKQPWMK